MDLYEAMRTNAAVRSFLPDAVPDAVLHRILDNARFAPSGGNTQPWHVIVVKDGTKRDELARLLAEVWNEYVAQRDVGHRPFSPDSNGRWRVPPIDLAEARRTPRPGLLAEGFATAPVVLVVTVHMPDLALVDAELDREHFVGGASIYPLCQNILLAARAEGIGGLFSSFLVRREAEVRSLLDVPTGWFVAGTIILGRPERKSYPPEPTRSRGVHHNRRAQRRSISARHGLRT